MRLETIIKNVGRVITSLTALLLFGCGSVTKTVKVVDASGDPIQGAVQYPGVTFGNDSSGSSGRLRVNSNFPVIVKDGFRPVIAHLGNESYTVVTLTEQQESTSEEEALSFRNRLAGESFQLSGEFTRTLGGR
jgi:hypothetical protein